MFLRNIKDKIKTINLYFYKSKDKTNSFEKKYNKIIKPQNRYKNKKFNYKPMLISIKKTYQSID
jgi:hypothetical protein